MAHRDQQLVSALGIPLARVARAMDKSRQTVNRGVRSASDYFKPADFVRALGFWRSTNPKLFALAKEKVCELYPEVAGAVLEAAEVSNSGISFSTEVPGEYWFLCGDFLAFRNSLAVCSGELERLCGNQAAYVSLFVSARDRQAVLAATRLKLRFESDASGRIHVVPCTDHNLEGIPSTLLRIQDDGTMELFGVSDHGFVGLSRQEAARLRKFVQENLLDNNKGK